MVQDKTVPNSTTTDPGEDLDVIARVTTYEDLLKVCVARRKELGLPQMLVDEIAGLQPGYTGKLECGDKRLGPLSLPCLLQALGLVLAVVRDTPHHERQRRLAPGATAHRIDAGNHVRSTLLDAA